MFYRILSFAAALTMVAALAGCGSSNESQIASSVQDQLQAAIDDGNRQLIASTGGGIESVETLSVDVDNRVANVRMKFANGEVQADQVRIKEIDGKWHAEL